jgi:hypothetical protein
MEVGGKDETFGGATCLRRVTVSWKQMFCVQRYG